MLTPRKRITEIVDRYVDADFPSVRKALIDEVEALIAPSRSVREAAEALKSAGLLWSNEAAAELGGDPFDDEAQIEQVAEIISRHCSPVSAAGGDEDDLSESVDSAVNFIEHYERDSVGEEGK